MSSATAVGNASGRSAGPIAAPAAGAVHKANFECLDGLRFIAAFMVVCAHTLGFGWTELDLKSQFVHSLGHYGVAVFFCLSGFLLYRPFVIATIDGAPMPALRPYLRNRLLRIVPLFWFALAVYVFIFPTTQASLPKTPAEWIGMVLVGQVYFNNGINWAIFAAWTLGVELAFYFALPFISKALRWCANKAGPKKEHRFIGVFGGLLGVAAVGLLYKIVIHQSFAPMEAINGFPPAWLDWFAVGMAMATAHTAQARGFALPQWMDILAKWPALSWIGSFGFFWISVQSYYYFLSPATLAHSLLRHYAMVLAGALLLVPAVFGTEHKTPIRRFLASRPMAALGLISYGVYLWHPGFVKLFYTWAIDGSVTLPGIGTPPDRWTILAWVTAATLIVSTISYWGVERLFMSWKKSTGPSVAQQNLGVKSTTSGLRQPGATSVPGSAKG